METKNFSSYASCRSCSTVVACCAEMLGVVWSCLRLISRDSYLAAVTILTQVINFITCTCAKLAWNFIIKRCYLTSWSVCTLLQYTVVVLYVDIVACFPIEVTAVVIH